MDATFNNFSSTLNFLCNSGGALMALIPQDSLATLNLVSKVKNVASTASLDAERMAVAKLINSSANTGVYEALYNHPMSDDIIKELKSRGYKVAQRPASFTADPSTQYIISWK